MDLNLYSPTPPSGLTDSFGHSELSSDSGIVASTPRYFTPRGTSIDCRNLPRTSELVAKFEKNIQDYHSRKEGGSSRTRTTSSSRSGNPSRVESFSLRQRQILYSPRSDNETEPSRSRRETKLRLRQDKPPDTFDLELKRASCGLRIACPTAKSALFSGANRPCVSPFSLQTDSILSSPRSQFLETSTTSDIETSSDNLALSNPVIVKPPRMSPITIVTTASSSHIPNMIMGNASNSHGISSGSSMHKCYYSSTDSGAETMTSFSNYDSLQSTPNRYSTNHSVAELPANQRVVEIQANQRATDFPASHNSVSRPTSLLTTETEDSQQRRSYRSSVTCSYSANKGLSSSSDVTESGQGDSQQLRTPKSSIKTPTKIIRKTRLSNFAFCGLSKSCTKTTKIRDPYIPSPSQAPSTPITTPHRIHRLNGLEAESVHSLETSLNGITNNSSMAIHSPVRVQVNAAPAESELKYPTSVPPKKPIRASFIRPVRFSYCEDDQLESQSESTTNAAVPQLKKYFASDFEIESNASVEKRGDSRAGTMNSEDVRNAMKSLSLRSEDNLSCFTTGDEECELSSLAESFSSRDNTDQQTKSNVPALFSMPLAPSNLISLASSLKRKSLGSQSQPTRPGPLPLAPNVMTPTAETTVTPQTATLVPNGVVLDEETFQRTMKDLNEMKVLLGTLMKSLQCNPISHQCDSPLEEGLREDIYRRFTAQIRATLYQDASTQTTSADPEIPEPEKETQFCIESSLA